MIPTPDSPATLEFECRGLLMPTYLPLGDILRGLISQAIYPEAWVAEGTMTPDEAAGVFQQIFDQITGPCRMIGEVAAKFGDVPDGWLSCDGSDYETAVYPQLAAALGPMFDIGGGRFVVPDMRDRTVIGSGALASPGQTGGEIMHTLTAQEMPEHTHNYQQYTFGIDIETVGVPDPTGVGQPTVPQTTTIAGGGQPHNNMPPYLAVPMIIYSGVYNA